MVFGLRSLFEFDILPDPHDALARLVQAGVRPLVAVTKGHNPIHKALVAYSGSMESAKAMKRFVQVRLWPDARLRIVTCEPPRDEAEKFVGDAGEYCRAHGFDVDEAYLPESPKSHLLPYAEAWGADLIVIGNSAKNLLLRQIFGETALHVIRHSDRPLFLAQ
ncbi:MAG: universal stress protein [Planctomycetes bacterium]|nr:universal stress protein [Planctomycetota bacterium]